ncbi:MAG: hypothetical protein ACK4GM_15785, partial [Tabrizicola sp.]
GLFRTSAGAAGRQKPLKVNIPYRGSAADGRAEVAIAGRAAGLPEGFDAFRPARSLLMTPEEAQAARDPALAEWRAALAK